MSLTKQDGAPVGDTLREKESIRGAALDAELDAFIDAVMEEAGMDGLPRARSENEAAAMADVRPYLTDKSREALRGKLWHLLNRWMDAQAENGVL